MEISSWEKLIKTSLASIVVSVIIGVVVFIPLRYSADFGAKYVNAFYALFIWIVLSFVLLVVCVLKLDKLYKAKSVQTVESDADALT